MASASWRQSVDFPMPGSPPISTTLPGTSPPPSTRSSSAMPVSARGDASAGTSRSGIARPSPRAAPVSSRSADAPPAGAPTGSSTSDCHAPQPGAAPEPTRLLRAALGADVDRLRAAPTCSFARSARCAPAQERRLAARRGRRGYCRRCDGLLYDFYERRVFPHVLDSRCGGSASCARRRSPAAHGDVLEIGFGTGLNLAHYPAGVSKLVDGRPDGGAARARARAHRGRAVPGRDPPPARRPHAAVRRAGASTASR